MEPWTRIFPGGVLPILQGGPGPFSQSQATISGRMFLHGGEHAGRIQSRKSSGQVEILMEASWPCQAVFGGDLAWSFFNIQTDHLGFLRARSNDGMS